MGQVFLAKHREAGRNEAVKVLKPEVASEPRFVARFRREARATNRLHHPNIVAMHDFGQLPDGRFYMAMEYVDGAPISVLLRETGRFAVERVVHVACQLASAVEHAHSRGVVHRDLKPANLMLVESRNREDVLKILDFGVAKIISPEYTESIMVSQQGVVFGTPLYMAPEQFQDNTYDPRSDLYAIGCIVCELLTGRPPFVGSVQELVIAHTETAPTRPSLLVPGTSTLLDDIIMRCLVKQPEVRYQSAGELLGDLVTLHPRHGHIPGPDSAGVPVPNLAPYELYESLSSMAHTLSREPSFPGAAEPATDRMDRERAAEERRQALLQALVELGEALLDHGAGDVLLTVTVADVRSVEHELGACDIEIRTLAERESRIEQGAREREGMLRFAIGELTFERDRGATDPTLDYQIGELEKRLGEVRRESRAELSRLAEQAIELAARKDEIEERRAEIYARLVQLVDDISPAFDHELSLAPLIDRYQCLRGI